MQTVALTGATGFLGPFICRTLLDAGFGLRCLTRGKTVPAEATRIAGDLDDKRSLHELLRGATAVVHMAAATRGGNPRRFQHVNVRGTRQLANAAKSVGCKRFIYISSDLAEIACEPYGQSKRDAEHVILNSALDWTILRFPAVYGPPSNGKACGLERLARKIRTGSVLIPGDGSQRLSFLHAADAAEAVLRALHFDETIAKRHFVGPRAISLDTAISVLAEGLGVRVQRRYIPWRIPRSIVRTALTLFRALPFDIVTLLTIDRDRNLDGAAFRNTVNWRPRSVADGLREFAVRLRALAHKPPMAPDATGTGAPLSFPRDSRANMIARDAKMELHDAR